MHHWMVGANHVAQGGDIISLETRLPRVASRAGGRWAVRKRSAAFPLLVICGLVAAISAIGMFSGRDARDAVVRLPAPLRAEIFARARDDLAQTCALPAAADGPLREHCIAQARFILQFPECDQPCVQAARARLPRVTR